jgi:hypothetical protein
MTRTTQWTDLLGKWSGTKQIWLSPDAEALTSESTAQVSTVAQGQFIALAYTWAIEDQPQDGLILFPSAAGEAPSRAAWLDSWHVRNDMMPCEATRESGLVSLSGSYPAPPGPDWGWRIEIETGQIDTLAFRMFNITPEGQEALAVRAQYERAQYERAG